MEGIGRLMPGDCWIRWDLVVRTYIFSNRLVLEKALQSLLSVVIMDTSFTVHGEVKGGSDMKAEF
jgi:hypothetical protein